MNKITREEVLHLAQLSSLQLSDDEVSNLASDLDDILKYIDLLNELDTSSVQPTYQVSGLNNVWRNDEVCESSVGRETLLDLAGEHLANSVKVPQVL